MRKGTVTFVRNFSDTGLVGYVLGFVRQSNARRIPAAFLGFPFTAKEAATKRQHAKCIGNTRAFNLKLPFFLIVEIRFRNERKSISLDGKIELEVRPAS